MVEEMSLWSEDYDAFLKSKKRGRIIAKLIYALPFLLMVPLVILSSNGPIDVGIHLILIAGIIGGSIIGPILYVINDIQLKGIKYGTAIISQIAEPRFDFKQNLVYCVYDNVIIIARGNNLFFAVFTGHPQLSEDQSIKTRASCLQKVEWIKIAHLHLMKLETYCRLPSQDGLYYEDNAILYQIGIVRRNANYPPFGLVPNSTASVTYDLEGKDLLLKVIEHIKNDAHLGEP